jgi:hypothetical protein
VQSVLLFLQIDQFRYDLVDCLRIEPVCKFLVIQHDVKDIAGSIGRSIFCAKIQIIDQFIARNIGMVQQLIAQKLDPLLTLAETFQKIGNMSIHIAIHHLLYPFH